ncbi:hypothetical protein D6774_04790 [Candidatus Woesearchaeota archaeon]|jgi:flagellar motility protein MotE (MotC chaperone)|nr:MAG: hypothetical protein D6774_04790 [Candidatus Woesearchaeota archaeon]
MPDGLPIDLVRQYQQQGLTNDQIVNYLMQAGYTHDQILQAFNQAALKQDIMPSAVEPQENLQGVESYEQTSDRDRIEEIAEAIIDEKWEHLVANINQVIEWKEKTEARMASLETKFEDLKNNFDKLHASILERVGSYDKHIQDVGTEIKALEKVFQKILPGFIENVAELSRITNSLKGKQL